MKAESSDLKKSPDPRERGPWRCLRAHQLAPSVLLAHGHAARGESPLLAESRRAGAAICHGSRAITEGLSTSSTRRCILLVQP